MINKLFTISILVVVLVGGIFLYQYYHDVSHNRVLYPEDRFKLSSCEIRVLEQKAAKKDISAMVRLGDYYCLYLSEDKKGFYWYEKAAFAGSREHQVLLVSVLLASKSQIDQRRGKKLRNIWKISSEDVDD